MSFNEELEARRNQIETILKASLPKEQGYGKTVIEAMNYSVLSQGKRIRPILMEASFQMFHGTTKAIENFMIALEMIHTYSLIHDDLPAMDNDEYRRGRKTTHIVYGEAIGILAGDGLLNLACEIAIESIKEQENGMKIGQALKVLFRKSGIHGMIGGQTADIEAEEMGNQVTLDHLIFIHKNKTAALIQAALMIGAILGNATDEQVEIMEKIGYNVGVAFQIQDDILDITSTFEILGKPIGSDEKNSKATYVTKKGLEESKNQVEKLSLEAIELLNLLPNKSEFLETLLTSLMNRKK